MKIIINFYLLMLALSILISVVSQLKKNTKRFTTNNFIMLFRLEF